MRLTVETGKIVETVAEAVGGDTGGILALVVCSLPSTSRNFVRNTHRGAVEGLHFPNLKDGLDESLAELVVEIRCCFDILMHPTGLMILSERGVMIGLYSAGLPSKRSAETQNEPHSYGEGLQVFLVLD